MGTYRPKPDLVRRLQEARDHFGVGVKINRGGGCRCVAYHTAIYVLRREAPRMNSRHLTGEAADISLSDGTPFTDEQVDFLRRLFGGLGVARSMRWMHVDTGPKREWQYDE